MSKVNEPRTCYRCGNSGPAYQKWNVCADSTFPVSSVKKYLCKSCDVALNRLVLKWVGDPEWRRKIKRYQEIMFNA